MLGVQSLEELCLASYLAFLETECKAWIDLTASGSRLLAAAAAGVLPGLRQHLASFLSGSASTNLRQRMFQRVTGGAFPSSRYRNSVEGNFQGTDVNFGLFESFHRLYEDVTKHSARCARLCCTGVFIVEAMLKVVINDELRELELPGDLVATVWGWEQGGFQDGGIETVVPFHYPALLASYTEAVLFPTASQGGGLLLRQPALTKLKIGNFNQGLDRRRSSQNWELLKSFQLTRQYLAFLPHLGPSQGVFSAVPPNSFDWPLEDKSGLLPTLTHAAFTTKSIFDFFSPKSLCNLGKFSNLVEISLNNTQSLLGWDQRGVELFSAIGKAVPRLRLLDLSDTMVFSGELLLYLVFQDAFHWLHRYMFLHPYHALGRAEQEEHLAHTGHFRTVGRDLESQPGLHSFAAYCPWCLDEGAYHDNLRPGCSQEFLPITAVDDRLWDFVHTMPFDETLKSQALLHCVKVSDLAASLTEPARVLVRDSALLPWEPGFLPEPGTETSGEQDGSAGQPGLWYPPAAIFYQQVEDVGYGLQRTNPLAESLQAIRLPACSRSLWGELVPLVLRACPALASLGRASGTMYALQLLDGMNVTAGLQEVFLHLDLLSPEDRQVVSTPGYGRLGHGDTLSQNSPSLRFLTQNFGPTALQSVMEADDQATVLRKEFCLEVWDQARLLLPEPDPAARLGSYLELMARRAPRTRALHLLALAQCPGLAAVPWNRMRDLPDLTQLTLQTPSLAEYAGLLRAVGAQLERATIIGMLGQSEGGEAQLVEGLDLEEQGGLYVCEKCPNAISLDLVKVNVSMKFFFGRRFEPQPNHFRKLTELAIGKVDWDTLKQIWAAVPVLKSLTITAIVPHFTLHEQLFEEPLVMTIDQAQELQVLGSGVRHSLVELQVPALRFATFLALDYFVGEFSGQLKKIGSIDGDTFNQAEREELAGLVRRLGEAGLEMDCCEMFDLY